MVKDAQHALHQAVAHFVASNGPAEAAFGGLFVAAAVFGVGWGYRDLMSRWLAASVRTVGLLLAVAVLALQVSDRAWLTGVDHSVTAWLVTHRNPTIDHLALAVTNALGPVETAGLATIVAVVVGMRFRSVLCGLTVLATVGGASALCSVIKLLVARPRPPIVLQETLETDYSFPSGHVTGTAALFGILAVALGLAGSRALKSLLVTVAVLTTSAVALSRLYLGVHWLTDAAAGALLAAAAVTVGAASLRVLVDSKSPPTLEGTAPAAAHDPHRGHSHGGGGAVDDHLRSDALGGAARGSGSVVGGQNWFMTRSRPLSVPLTDFARPSAKCSDRLETY
jgi:membrane-associated phospholipid phosphatase